MSNMFDREHSVEYHLSLPLNEKKKKKEGVLPQARKTRLRSNNLRSIQTQTNNRQTFTCDRRSSIWIFSTGLAEIHSVRVSLFFVLSCKFVRTRSHTTHGDPRWTVDAISITAGFGRCGFRNGRAVNNGACCPSFHFHPCFAMSLLPRCVGALTSARGESEGTPPRRTTANHPTQSGRLFENKAGRRVCMARELPHTELAP